LITELDEVSIKPATGDLCEPVKFGDTCLRENASKQVPNNAPDTMYRKYLLV
jgi:hypothetical protein